MLAPSTRAKQRSTRGEGDPGRIGARPREQQQSCEREDRGCGDERPQPRVPIERHERLAAFAAIALEDGRDPAVVARGGHLGRGTAQAETPDAPQIHVAQTQQPVARSQSRSCAGLQREEREAGDDGRKIGAAARGDDHREHAGVPERRAEAQHEAVGPKDREGQRDGAPGNDAPFGRNEDAPAPVIIPVGSARLGPQRARPSGPLSPAWKSS